MKKIIMALFCVLSINVMAQKQTVEIKTTAQCDMCKSRIEKELQFTKGVTAVNLDVESQMLSVTFKTKKTDSDKIRTVVSKLGYDADEIKAEKEAHFKLPFCCQNPDFIEPEKE